MPNAEERAKELHQLIDDPVAQDKVTIAVLTTDKETIIGTNERRLREKQRKALKKGEIEAPHIEANHAEEKAIKEAKKRNLKIKEIGTSRNLLTLEKLEQIVHDLGFENSTVFLEKNAISMEKEMPFELFLSINLKKYLLAEIKEWKKKIHFFEKKYQTSFQNLRDNFHQFTAIDEIEKEADEVEWEMALAFIAAHQQSLIKL